MSKFKLFKIILFVFTASMADAATNNPPPNDPSDLFAFEISANLIDLIWTDNSCDETGFTIAFWRSDNDNSNLLLRKQLRPMQQPFQIIQLPPNDEAR